MAETGELPETRAVTIILQRRPDGGLRVHSDTLPGLILSGPDEEGVAQCVGPAILTLLEHRGEMPAVPTQEQEAALMATYPPLPSPAEPR